MARSRKRTLQKQAAQRKKKRQNLWWIGGAAIFAALIILVVYLNIRNNAPIGDEQRVPSLGNMHIEVDSVSPIDYNSTPPTSGPHYGSIVPWNIYTEPQRYEHVIHNFEDGGVAIYYQCEEECPELVRQLEEIVEPYVRAERRVLLMPNDPTWQIGDSQPLHRDMESRIALTAWERIDKFDEFDEERVRAFIERYEGIDHH